MFAIAVEYKSPALVNSSFYNHQSFDDSTKFSGTKKVKYNY